jgi:hypothetical protein
MSDDVESTGACARIILRLSVFLPTQDDVIALNWLAAGELFLEFGRYAPFSLKPR